MAITTCFVPVRRRADSSFNLAHIPAEIYLEIFDWLRADNKALVILRPEYQTIVSNLILTCRYFAVIVRPLLFNTIELVWDGDLAGKWSRKLDFYKDICANQSDALSLASLVRVWKFCRHSEASGFDHCLDIVTLALPALSNLQSMMLHGIPIGQMFIGTVVSLTSLDALSINGCNFESATAYLISAQLPPLNLKLKSFHLVDTDNRSVQIPPSLAPIVITPALRILRVDDVHFAGVVFTMPIASLNLKELSLLLDSNDAANGHLADFLNRSASITTLHINVVFTQPSHLRHPFHIPSLPNLQVVRCPPFLMPRLVQDQRVMDIDLTMPLLLESHINLMPLVGSQELAINRRVLSYLKNSTAITILRIPMHTLSHIPPEGSFSHLRYLSVTCQIRSNTSAVHLISHLCSTIAPQMPRLSDLCLDPRNFATSEDSLERQFSLVLLLATAFPSLIRITIDRKVLWWALDPERSQWMPQILWHFRSEFTPEELEKFDATTGKRLL